MANVLLITDYYPPRKSVATNRMKAFEKYLSQMGHKLFVITLGEKYECVVENTTTVYYCTNDDWLKTFDTNIKESAISHYLKCAFNIVYNSIYLYSGSWVKNIVKTVTDIIEEQAIDVMITSYPTIATLLAGEIIKKQAPNIKWIMDMRDAVWTPNANDYLRTKQINLVKRCMKKCDAVTVVSQPQLEQYEMYGLGDIEYKIVFNGYDFEVPELKQIKHEKFKIIYAGNFYGALSPKHFLKALDMLERKHLLEEICFEIIGNHSIVNYPSALQNVVRELPRMEYEELIEYCAENADLLLVVIPRSREEGVYTGKIFDYVGIGKPILGLVPKDDVAAALIKQAGNGYVAENENIEEIVDTVHKAYRDWKNNNVMQINKEVQSLYHRREQVAKLDELIRNLINKRESGTK